MGLGVARAGALRGSNSYSYETAIEAFATFSVTPWLGLQPDIQYIINPGATGEKDAVILGLRLHMHLGTRVGRQVG
jgi:porin